MPAEQLRVANASIANLQSSIPLFWPVNLRFLQLVRIIHVDGLPLGIKINGAQAAFAVAVARLLDAAKGQVHLGADGGRVDVGNARFQVAHGGEGLVDITSVDGGGEPVFDVVGDLVCRLLLEKKKKQKQ